MATYELLTGKQLPLQGVGKINYIDLIDKDRYFTGKEVKIQRWGVNDNLLGTAQYCPVIRKTEALYESLSADFPQLIREVYDQFPKDIFQRAVHFLYTKETRSSYKIEREEPSPDRMNKFIAILEKAGDEPIEEVLQEETLVQFQNEIVDPRFADKSFRDHQNFIGQTNASLRQIYHYICPPPEFIPTLMEGLRNMALKTSGQHPIVQAASAAFGFVFIHPFEDGNGRIHRFLIHDFLTRAKLVEKGRNGTVILNLTTDHQ